MEEKAYRVYVTDVLKAIAESTGCQVSMRYNEAISTSNDEEELNGDQIALDIIERAGLKGTSP